MKKTILIFIITSFIFCGISYAQPRGDHRGQECQQDVRQDIEKANNMVRHGIKTGQIDSREADRIRQNIRRVENDLNRFISDGRLNPGECQRLQRETRDLYKHIRYEMNDGNARRDYRGQECQEEIRQDLSRARVMVRDGVNSEKISPQELFVINKKIENLENDLNRSRSDGRLRPEECAGLKQKAKDLIDTIMYASTN